MKTAVLFLSHLTDDLCFQRYKKLVNEVGEEYDVFWAFQAGGGTNGQHLLERGVNLFQFTVDELNQLDYTPIAETLVPGSIHFIVAWFFRKHSEYDHYWTIEYDVVYTDTWSTFFDSFRCDDADLLASHVELRNERNVQWSWWKSLSVPQETETVYQHQVKCFAPVYRLSRNALLFLDNVLKMEGYSGHMEVLLPTLLFCNGYRIEDYGGTGPFTPQSLRNRFYVEGTGLNNGTMRWRPVFLKEEIEALGTKEKLFHPVKA